MKSVILYPYTLSVRKKRTEEFCDIHSFDGEHSLIDSINAFLSTFKSISKDEEKSVAFTIDEYQSGENVVKGNISRGEFGEASSLYNTQTRNVDFHQEPIHANMSPFYFQINANFLPEKAICMFQSLGVNGAKTDFDFAFRDFFKKTFPEYTIQFLSLIPQEALDFYFKTGKIRKIKIKQNQIPSNISQALGSELKTSDGEVTFSISLKKNATPAALESLARRIRGDAFRRGFAELGPINEPDVLSVDLEIEGKTRSINLDRPDSFRMGYDVSTKVKRIKETGLLSFDDIDGQASELIEEMMKSYDS